MRLLFAILLLYVSTEVIGQTNSAKPTKRKATKDIFIDPDDGQMDMSDFLISYHGFIPVPGIVTEPALGSFGGNLAAVFIQPNKYASEKEYIPPDITAGYGMYTVNNSWSAGAMRSASLPQYKLRYRVGAFYGNFNLDLYRNLPFVGEQQFGFNFKMTGAFLSVLRELGESDFYLGMSYSFLQSKVGMNAQKDSLPAFVTEKEINSSLSSIGFQAQLDKRDNVFTPNIGWYFSGNYLVNANWTGSAYNFQFLNLFVLKYFQFTPNWISGFRVESSFIFDVPPFYLKPSVNLRGVPIARYQGNESYVIETEQRFDFTPRWSILAFTGMGKATTENTDFSSATLVYNYGTGFRYLIARKFGIRMGVDFAWSNENFGWYIIFGSAWNNRN